MTETANSNVTPLNPDRYSAGMMAGLQAVAAMPTAEDPTNHDLLAEIVIAQQVVESMHARLLRAMGPATSQPLVNKCLVITASLNATHLAIGAAKAVKL